MPVVPDTARIFVGCAANNEDLESQAVFEYSLRKYASIPVDITWMQLSRNPSSPFYSAPEKKEGWVTKAWATPFSGFRWVIPSLCEYTGKGIYFDSDFIIKADIAELYYQGFNEGRVVISKGGGRFCCSMWNCEAFQTHPAYKGLKWLQSTDIAHASLSSALSKDSVVQNFMGGDWNVMDIALPENLDDPSIKALHYTNIPTQLQLKYALPRLKAAKQQHWFEGTYTPHHRQDFQALFDRMLEEAKDAGFKPERYTKTPYGHYSIRGRD